MRFISLTFFALLFFTGYGQQEDTLRKDDLFSKGIYLENLQIILPWEIDFNNLSKYGNPKIINGPHGKPELKWDSLKILNGVTTNLSCLISKKILTKKSKIMLGTLYGSIGIIDLEKLRIYLNDYTNFSGKKISSAKDTFYYWTINNCYVRIGVNKFMGPYLLFQPEKPLFE